MSDSTSAAAVPGIPAEEKETGLPSEAKAEDARWVEGAGDDEGDLDAEGDEDEYFRQHFKAATEARPVGAGSGSGVEGGGEGEEYEEGFEDAGAIAGAGAAAESEEDSRYPPDLILGDGRIISRKPRPTQEEDELDESKKDITMANAMKEEGNRNFTEAKYDTAVACYTEALRFVPKSPDFLEHKAVFYANRAACYLQLGQTDEALYDCDRALENNPRYVKAVARRLTVFEKFQKLEEALADAELWVTLDPKSLQAKDAVSRLKKAVQERDEKLKEEMMGKLKDMGNWVLGKFGLSLDNFKAVQDPKTGSYSINFQK